MAEVLITLGVIGIVAALTIPSLVSKINDKVVENQKKVMNSKIVQGLNMLNSQENGLTKSYANSEEFVQALSKYMKISTICSKDELNKCLGYDKVNYDKNGETKDVELTSITTASKLKLEDGFLDPAGFVMGDGTPIIVSWNSNCSNGTQEGIILDPDQPLKAIPTSCFDGLYDINGTRKSNMYGKDVLPFGSAKIGTSYPGTEVPGIGYVYNIGTQYEAINTTVDSTYDSRCTDSTNTSCTENYWAGAKAECAKLGMELPDLGTLYNKIYPLRGQYGIPQTGDFWSSSDHASYVYRAYSMWIDPIDDSCVWSAGGKHFKSYVLCVGK